LIFIAFFLIVATGIYLGIKWGGYINHMIDEGYRLAAEEAAAKKNRKYIGRIDVTVLDGPVVGIDAETAIEADWELIDEE